MQQRSYLDAAEMDKLQAATLVLLHHSAYSRRKSAALLTALNEPLLADVTTRFNQLRVRQWLTCSISNAQSSLAEHSDVRSDITEHSGEQPDITEHSHAQPDITEQSCTARHRRAL